MNDEQFLNSVAIVTGAGAGIAKVLAERSVTVVIADVNEENGQRACERASKTRG